MRHSLLRLSVLALLLTINTIVFADTFVVNGIKYSTTSSSTVGVYSKSPKYSGNVVIPESVNYNETTYSVTSIGDCAFSSCINLKTVTIGKNVTEIGAYAFDTDDNWKIGSLTKIISLIEEPFEVFRIFRYWTRLADYSNVFIQANDTLFVPKGTVPLYKSTPDWCDVKNILEIEESTDIIDISNSTLEDNSAFYNLNGIVATKPRKGIYIKNGKKIVIK